MAHYKVRKLTLLKCILFENFSAQALLVKPPSTDEYIMTYELSYEASLQSELEAS